MGSGHRAATQGGRGLGATADSMDGGADVRLAGEMPAPEQGPGEERQIVGDVHQAGYDPTDAQPAFAQRNRCRVPVPCGCINSLMGQSLSRSGMLSFNAARILARSGLGRATRRRASFLPSVVSRSISPIWISPNWRKMTS